MKPFIKPFAILLRIVGAVFFLMAFRAEEMIQTRFFILAGISFFISALLTKPFPDRRLQLAFTGILSVTFVIFSSIQLYEMYLN